MLIGKKLRTKLFNWSEVHLYQSNFLKIHILVITMVSCPNYEISKKIRRRGESQSNCLLGIWFRVVMGTKKCPLDCGILLIPVPSLDLKKRAFVIIIRSLTPSPGSFSRGNSTLSTKYCAFTCGITNIALLRTLVTKVGCSS